MIRSKAAITVALLAVAGACTVCTKAVAQVFIPVNQFRGINWACPGDNYSTSVLYLSGLSPSSSSNQARALADRVAGSVLSIGGTMIRVPVNPPTVDSAFWPTYKAALDTLIGRGLKVDLCCWTAKNTEGTIDNMSAWAAMWHTLVQEYGAAKSVYFEPINEPFGYSAADLESLYANFQSTYQLPHWKCFFDGTGYADHVTSIGADSAIEDQYLSQHYYRWYAPGGRSTNWQDYDADLSARIGKYQTRTVITEMGTVASTNLDYYGQSGDGLNLEVEYLMGVTQYVRTNHLGSLDWAGIRDGDSYAWWDSSLSAPKNISMIKQYQWSWGIASSPVGQPQ